MKDFFISYTSADKQWAEWIAWHLEEAQYSVVIQAWDFQAGESFINNMQKAALECHRTIAVLSTNYFASNFTYAEWEAAFKKDPKGEKGILLPIRIQEFDVPGLVGRLAYIDLVGLDKEAAVERLLNNIRTERKKPDSEPGFPGSEQGKPSKQIMEEPPFPGKVLIGDHTNTKGDYSPGKVSGDYIAGDKVAGDKISGDKIIGGKKEVHHHYPKGDPRPKKS